MSFHVAVELYLIDMFIESAIAVKEGLYRDKLNFATEEMLVVVNIVSKRDAKCDQHTRN